MVQINITAGEQRSGDKCDDAKLNINVLIVLFTKKEEKPFRF